LEIVFQDAFIKGSGNLKDLKVKPNLFVLEIIIGSAIDFKKRKLPNMESFSKL